jgi:hypothetical protein
MPWVRFADDYLTNAKMRNLDAYARLLDFCAVVYSARELCDGELSLSDVQTVAALAKIRRWNAAVQELCAAGRWIRNADGSYSIHDYLEYQPSRAQVLAERKEKHEAKVRAGRAGGLAKASRTPSSELAEPLANVYQNPSPVPVPGDVVSVVKKSMARARAPDAAQGPRRAPASSSDRPSALRPEQQQCPLCPEVFPDNAALRQHLDESPRHKVRPEHRGNVRRPLLPGPDTTPPEVKAELNAMATAPKPAVALSPELEAEHERLLARERSRNGDAAHE